VAQQVFNDWARKEAERNTAILLERGKAIKAREVKNWLRSLGRWSELCLPSSKPARMF
jgi:hypothetical protein